ncbi:Low molecular weight protein-tyrosine-phosphatase etp [Serratia fonticola]|nr:Low molecular weight protein-tyrosine-phosphatase etp [Serratia fonticola]
MLFGHWLKQIDVPDPYRRSNELFEHVFQLLDEAAGHWEKMLTK